MISIRFKTLQERLLWIQRLPDGSEIIDQLANMWPEVAKDIAEQICVKPETVRYNWPIYKGGPSGERERKVNEYLGSVADVDWHLPVRPDYRPQTRVKKCERSTPEEAT
ncbi:MAG: hypothetical protein KBT20_00900 [Bacteroidales bacterium]|nr:hypothetical protein [Candidatus Liminaster caballi]